MDTQAGFERLLPTEIDLRLREASLEWLDMFEKRQRYKVPYLRTLIETSRGQVLVELHAMVDLCAHFIDTEEKLAKKVLGPDYIERWMKQTRARLREQKAQNGNQTHRRKPAKKKSR